MSVATPVLERRTETEEETPVRRYPTREEDALHNSLIGERYAKLINPEFTMRDLRAEDVSATAQEPVQEEAQPKVEPAKPELITNARADSYIFRADSFVNNNKTQPETAVQNSEEEENEDLRPTSTTIQYKTTDVKKTEEEGKISNVSAEKRVGLSKRDKIIVAVVVSVIVALFVLIIVNSAIISGLNSDLSSLQSSLNNAHIGLGAIQDERSEYLLTLEEKVKTLAESLGMVKN